MKNDFVFQCVLVVTLGLLIAFCYVWQSTEMMLRADQAQFSEVYAEIERLITTTKHERSREISLRRKLLHKTAADEFYRAERWNLLPKVIPVDNYLSI